MALARSWLIAIEAFDAPAVIEPVITIDHTCQAGAGRHVQRARGRGWHLDVLAMEVLSPSPHNREMTQTSMSPKLIIITRVLSEITRIPLNDPALLRCFLSAVTPCTMLLLAARGAPGPMHDLRQMPPDVITDHLHRFALAGLDAVAREYARRQARTDQKS